MGKLSLLIFCLSVLAPKAAARPHRVKYVIKNHYGDKHVQNTVNKDITGNVATGQGSCITQVGGTGVSRSAIAIAPTIGKQRTSDGAANYIEWISKIVGALGLEDKSGKRDPQITEITVVDEEEPKDQVKQESEEIVEITVENDKEAKISDTQTSDNKVVQLIKSILEKTIESKKSVPQDSDEENPQIVEITVDHDKKPPTQLTKNSNEDKIVEITMDDEKVPQKPSVLKNHDKVVQMIEKIVNNDKDPKKLAKENSNDEIVKIAVDKEKESQKPVKESDNKIVQIIQKLLNDKKEHDKVAKMLEKLLVNYKLFDIPDSDGSDEKKPKREIQDKGLKLPDIVENVDNEPQVIEFLVDDDNDDDQLVIEMLESDEVGAQMHTLLENDNKLTKMLETLSNGDDWSQLPASLEYGDKNIQLEVLPLVDNLGYENKELILEDENDY